MIKNFMAEPDEHLPTLQELKRQMREKAATMYPTTQYPDWCFVFDVGLHIDPRNIVANRGVSKKNYEIFVLDANGNKIMENGRMKTVMRKFSAQQQKVLREWWPLLNDDVKRA